MSYKNYYDNTNTSLDEAVEWEHGIWDITLGHSYVIWPYFDDYMTSKQAKMYQYNSYNK